MLLALTREPMSHKEALREQLTNLQELQKRGISGLSASIADLRARLWAEMGFRERVAFSVQRVLRVN